MSRSGCARRPAHLAAPHLTLRLSAPTWPRALRRSHGLYRLSLHIKIAMIQLIYDKSLRVTGAVKAERGVGSIVNLQSNDAAKIWNMPLFLHVLWNGPFQVWNAPARSGAQPPACALSRSAARSRARCSRRRDAAR